MGRDEVLRAPHVLEFPYTRSTGPVIGGFLTGLRDGRILGVRSTAPAGTVVVPPTEYDPVTGDDTGDLVEVGPAGIVTSWGWAAHPRPDQRCRATSRNATSTSSATACEWRAICIFQKI